MKTLKFALIALACCFGLSLSAQSTTTHIVEPGETLQKIAEKYGTTYEKILELNPDAQGQMIYVGMALIVPEAPKTAAPVAPSTPTTTYNNTSNTTGTTYSRASSNYSNSNQSYSSSSSGFNPAKRNKTTFELGFTNLSVESVSKKSVYGFNMQFLPWHLGGRFYIGLNISPINVNAGLCGKRRHHGSWEEDQTFMAMLGPSVGFYIKEGIFVSFPVDATLRVTSADEYELHWGMMLMPTFYFGKRVGLFAGPLFNFNFNDDYEKAATFGFRGGFYF